MTSATAWSAPAASAAQRYHHDCEGNLDCVTTDAGSVLDCNQPTGETVSSKLVAVAMTNDPGAHPHQWRRDQQPVCARFQADWVASPRRLKVGVATGAVAHTYDYKVVFNGAR